MQKKLILDPRLLTLTVGRLCRQLIENHDNFADTALIGLQPRGVYFADWLCQELEKLLKRKVLLGYLDPTFHRDDFRRRDAPVAANETQLPFSVEDKRVVLIDDVLFTGRTVRAAMDAIIAFGRPSKIEFLALIDRKYSRDLPIAADYVGKYVHTVASQKVLVELDVDPEKSRRVWLVNPE